ncbi:hypothetical protein [Streptomyces sp. NPDC026673]|uniref:hypothetical protein n=1 Tax=Streptomyces sp. NPDC026673 TaxID=3155724 RepID=UPI0033E84465
MTTYELGPTRLYTPGERLLHGKGADSAVGGGRAEDWVALDRSVWSGTACTGRNRSRIRVGFRYVDGREIADWERAPRWQEPSPGPGAPSWSLPPTESEVALCLGHADARVRATALAHTGSGALPVLPLVLIRCADGDQRVRALARAAFDHALADADEATLRRLAPLAALVGMRWRYGGWVREAVFGRLGGLPDEAVAQLLSGRGEEVRIAGLLAGVAYGRLGLPQVWAIAEGDPEESVRGHAVRTAMRLTLASGQQDVLDDARDRVLALVHADPSCNIRRTTHAAAIGAGIFRARDLADLATGHRDRRIRRRSCTAALAHADGNTFLDVLLSARDTTVRLAAVGQLRSAGRGNELVRHLADSSAVIRAAVCRELHAAGDDPRAHYQALCADPAAVTPAAVIGLAEQRHPEDAILLGALTRHPRDAVRARALSALRMLGVLPDDGVPPFADDPDPGVHATV